MTRKILMTGYTSQHIGNSHKMIIKYGAVMDLYRLIFEQAGFEVEHRRVLPDEDLTPYDVLVVGQGTINALGASYVYGALDAIGRAHASGCGLIFVIDDWQTHHIRTGLDTLNRDIKRLIRPSLVTARADMEWATANLHRLDFVIDALQSRPWPTTLVPKFTWGDGEKVVAKLKSREWLWTDLSPFAAEFNTEIPPDEEKWAQWVLGVLSDQHKWVDKIKPSWPVFYRGSKSAKAPDGKLTENALVGMYAQSWGVMAPPYRHAGSGWWRNRFVYSARVRSIMLADPKEIAPLGEPYLFNLAEVEAMNIVQLRDVAEAQADRFFETQADPEQVIEDVRRAVDNAVAEAL